MDAAHERGIPPQVLKGQIREESPGFSKDEIRYEPCSWDFASISAGATLINTQPYSLYAFDTVLADPGFDDTADLRNRYLINDGATTRFLTHADMQVSAGAIWAANDGPLTQQGYDLGAEDQNWSTIPCGARTKYLAAGHSVAQFMAALNFVAQTATASSYGVMQVMYGTAVQSPIKWSVPNPGRNIPGCPTTTDSCQSPRYLRDTPESLALPHGGSIFAGGHEDVWLYKKFGPKNVAFESQDEFFDSFSDPLREYTGGGIPDYGTKIIDVYQYEYLPVQPDKVFP